ncbi:MAG: hypothetical protein WCI72_02515 [archaeon]
MAYDEKKLEDSLSSLVKKEAPKQAEMSREEEIGFHKGTLNTLISERTELVKMIGNVEAIMQAHIQRLKALGVEIKGS